MILGVDPEVALPLLVWTIAVLCAAPDPTATKQVYPEQDGRDSHPADTD